MIQNISTNIPRVFKLYQNYPNPFNPFTKIRFDVPKNNGHKSMNIRLYIYDIKGREIAMLINQELEPGSYKIDLDASKYPSGSYYYKIVTDEFTDTKKMALVK
jgi:hypothetical protein